MSAAIYSNFIVDNEIELYLLLIHGVKLPTT